MCASSPVKVGRTTGLNSKAVSIVSCVTVYIHDSRIIEMTMKLNTMQKCAETHAQSSQMLREVKHLCGRTARTDSRKSRQAASP